MMNINRIPHIYHNTIYSKKLFEIIEDKHLRIRKLYDELNHFNDLNKCSGALLDIQGNNYRVFRNGRSDEEYRKAIIFEFNTIQFIGTVEEIKSIISNYFKIDDNSILLEEYSGKIYIRVPNELDVELLKKLLVKIKTAGVDFKIDYEIYIEDYLLSELEMLSLEELENIKLSRR